MIRRGCPTVRTPKGRLTAPVAPWSTRTRTMILPVVPMVPIPMALPARKPTAMTPRRAQPETRTPSGSQHRSTWVEADVQVDR